MIWIVAIGEAWLRTSVWMAGFAVAFALLERWMPCNPGMHWWKDLRASFTDIFYWFVAPIFLRVCGTILLVTGIVLIYDERTPNLLPVRALPLWLQCVLVEVLEDVLLYAAHRFFHSRFAWRFHAIHHSPRVLDWTSAARFHPLNNLFGVTCVDVIMLLLGFSPETFLILTPINVIYSAMVHANLNWTFGPLRYVLASPVFHRWHHTTEAEGLDKNFASTFPVLDLLFGSFYMPAGRLPQEFGIGDPDFPQSFWGQLLYPFRRSRRPAAVPATPQRQAA